jgi:hypothetical protein
MARTSGCGNTNVEIIGIEYTKFKKQCEMNNVTQVNKWGLASALGHGGSIIIELGGWGACLFLCFSADVAIRGGGAEVALPFPLLLQQKRDDRQTSHPMSPQVTPGHPKSPSAAVAKMADADGCACVPGAAARPACPQGDDAPGIPWLGMPPLLRHAYAGGQCKGARCHGTLPRHTRHTLGTTRPSQISGAGYPPS